MTLGQLNTAPEPVAREALLSCCGSKQWAEEMLAHRPFSCPETLYQESESIWNSLSPADWLQAFASHPKIGERSSSKWSNQEQQGMARGNADVVAEIRELNSRYERRFGYIFIVCATGKSAGEMCSLLKQRCANEPATELVIAAAEQARIMRLRLDKLLAE